MVDEPAALVLAFVQHMLAAGAKEVDLFLDTPNPQAQAILAGTAGCRVTVADDAFWADTPGKMRPAKKTVRQYVLAQIAYLRCDADWLLHCDVDELPRMGHALSSELAAVPEDMDHVTLRMAERVWTGPSKSLYAGAFRRKHNDYDTIGPLLHGDMAPYFIAGLSGHIGGKSLLRTGRPLRPGIHFARLLDESGPVRRSPKLFLPRTRLLHFDGLTPLHYAIKMLRHVFDKRSDVPRTSEEMPAHRLAQIGRVPELARRPAALANLVMRLMSVTPAQADLLRAHNLLDSKPFRPEVSDEVAAMLSPAAVDACLRDRYATMLEQHAPALLNAAWWNSCVRKAAGWRTADPAPQTEAPPDGPAPSAAAGQPQKA
jgi:hypothetical protein